MWDTCLVIIIPMFMAVWSCTALDIITVRGMEPIIIRGLSPGDMGYTIIRISDGVSHLAYIMVGLVGDSIPTEGLTGDPGATMQVTDMDITGATGMVQGMDFVRATGPDKIIPIGMYITTAAAG